MPILPKWDKSSPMYHGNCGVSHIPMKDRPEFIGDLDVITFNVDNKAEHIKVKNYNYYRLDLNSVEVQKVLQELVDEFECFI